MELPAWPLGIKIPAKAREEIAPGTGSAGESQGLKPSYVPIGIILNASQRHYAYIEMIVKPDQQNYH